MSEKLEKNFLELVKVVEDLQQRINRLEKTNQILIQSNRQLIDRTEDMLVELEDYKRNAAFEVNAGILEEAGFWYPRIVSGEVAIEQIINQRKSFARFGDGEFSAMVGRVRHKFQSELDPRLQERLREVLETDENNLLIGLANNYGSLEKYNEQAKREIRRYMNPDVRREHLAILRQEVTYYDAYVTRPYVMYADNMTDAPKNRFCNLQRIWDERECVFVEGTMTAMGVGNDLFANARSIERIIAPAENAFRAYEEILNSCKQQSKDKLFILALGPTATVLAYDLCKLGYQAVDLGHIDLEYEWFLKGEGRRTQVSGKYNNEVEYGEQTERNLSSEYQKQIIAECL